MKKIIVFSTEVYTDLDSEGRVNFKKIINEFIERDNSVIITSRDNVKLNKIKGEINSGNKKVLFLLRRKLTEIINSNKEKSHYFIMVGNRDIDFRIAVNNKFLYLMPMWTKEKYDKGLYYGIHIDNLEVLERFINTVNNQNNWFYELKLKDGTLVYSLISAHTRNWDISKEEKELVEGFENLLKRGYKKYYQILLYHFLAYIANNPKFREVDLWGIIPSSNESLNAEMLEFKERAHWCMGGRNPKLVTDGNRKNNMFLRARAITKSHKKSHEERMNLGSTVHFDSIIINDAFSKTYLKNKKVACIFDDYLTNGNSFEAARNLLKSIGFEKVILVSLGRFNRPYFYQEYEISGNVYELGGYKYKCKNKELIYDGAKNIKAREEVENLYEIFKLGDW